jgi:hypothetical protein
MGIAARILGLLAFLVLAFGSISIAAPSTAPSTEVSAAPSAASATGEYKAAAWWEELGVDRVCCARGEHRWWASSWRSCRNYNGYVVNHHECRWDGDDDDDDGDDDDDDGIFDLDDD